MAKVHNPPIRIQRRRTKGWKSPPNTIYVGRPSKWGNIFPIGSKPSEFSADLPEKCETLEVSLMCYKNYIDTWLIITDGRWINELKGKNLSCWCPLDKPCHSDILLEYAKSIQSSSN